MHNKVYAIVDVDICDPEGYGGYLHRISPALKSAGATYLVHGGPHKVLEGDWTPHRLFMMEFGSMSAAREFYAGPEYCDRKDFRLACGSSNVVLVHGLEDVAASIRIDTKDEIDSAKGYVIFDVKIDDMLRYQDFMQYIKPTIEAAGGRYLVRGGEHEVVEGEWDPDRLVLFEFPSVKKAEEFYFSDNYQGGAKKIRDECSAGKVVVVEGFTGA